MLVCTSFPCFTYFFQIIYILCGSRSLENLWHAIFRHEQAFTGLGISSFLAAADPEGAHETPLEAHRDDMGEEYNEYLEELRSTTLMGPCPAPASFRGELDSSDILMRIITPADGVSIPWFSWKTSLGAKKGSCPTPTGFGNLAMIVNVDASDPEDSAAAAVRESIDDVTLCFGVEHGFVDDSTTACVSNNTEEVPRLGGPPKTLSEPVCVSLVTAVQAGRLPDLYVAFPKLTESDQALEKVTTEPGKCPLRRAISVAAWLTRPILQLDHSEAVRNDDLASSRPNTEIITLVRSAVTLEVPSEGPVAVLNAESENAIALVAQIEEKDASISEDPVPFKREDFCVVIQGPLNNASMRAIPRYLDVAGRVVISGWLGDDLVVLSGLGADDKEVRVTLCRIITSSSLTLQSLLCVRYGLFYRRFPKHSQQQVGNERPFTKSHRPFEGLRLAEAHASRSRFAAFFGNDLALRVAKRCKLAVSSICQTRSDEFFFNLLPFAEAITSAPAKITSVRQAKEVIFVIRYDHNSPCDSLEQRVPSVCREPDE